MCIRDRRQFQYYKVLGEKAISQLDEEQLFFQPNEDTNSIAIIMQHLWGNMLSRWTDFKTTDGEKPWRTRDAAVSYTHLDVYKRQVSNISDNKNPIIAGVSPKDPVLVAMIGKYNTLAQKIEVENQPKENLIRKRDEAEITALRKSMVEAISKNESLINSTLQSAYQNSAKYIGLINTCL